MSNSNKIQDAITLILLVGTTIATGLVLVGGILFLAQHGGDTLNLLLKESHFNITLKHLAFNSGALFTIILGLLILVATQILRVLLLVFYYASIRDYKFTIISLFVLIVLLYSFIAQK